MMIARVINGKRYDPSTAESVASAHSVGLAYNDFGWWEESLYKKRTGEFFLHGSGGARTRYARSAGQNAWTGGEDVIPLTDAEARDWAEKHCDADEYESIFGPAPE